MQDSLLETGKCKIVYWRQDSLLETGECKKFIGDKGIGDKGMQDSLLEIKECKDMCI